MTDSHTKMDPALKAKWINALLSGEYQQGHGKLRQPTPNDEKYEYCCLGVLCDIIDPHGWLGMYHEMSDFFIPNTLSENTLKACGITRDKMNDLMRMNDGKISGNLSNYSYYDIVGFPLIAKWIEENL